MRFASFKTDRDVRHIDIDLDDNSPGHGTSPFSYSGSSLATTINEDEEHAAKHG